MANSVTGGDFARFAQERLRPAIDVVTAKKRRALLIALGVGLAVFAVFAIAVYLFLAPYRELMGQHSITYWPLLFLAPASLGMIVFCLVYILLLRQAVKEFRETLVGRMAEFIDPGMVHQPGGKTPGDDADADLLGAVGGPVVPGCDYFRGSVEGAAINFSDLRIRRKGEDGGKGLVDSGLLFRAAFKRKFKTPVLVFPETAEVSRSGLEASLARGGEDVAGGLVRLDDTIFGRQILVKTGEEEYAKTVLSSAALANMETLRRQSGADLYLSARGNVLNIILLTKGDKADAAGLFDGFDVGQCRDFCRDASMCVETARELAARGEVWEKA